MQDQWFPHGTTKEVMTRMTESVLSVDREEGNSLSTTESEDYVNSIGKIIATLQITDAVTTEKSKGRIVSSRCKDKKPQALLPFDVNHKAVIDSIWKKDPNHISLYKKSTKDRYKLVEDDYAKYLKVASVSDEYLVQELEKAGVKVQVRNPKLPDKNVATIESKVAHMETQSQLGMACAISQSWMLQYVSSQLNTLEKVLAKELSQDEIKSIYNQVDIKSVIDVTGLAQDAALDALDLQAREAAEAKWLGDIPALAEPQIGKRWSEAH